MSHLFPLRSAVTEFRRAQRNYAVYGTGESEPDDLFQLLLVRAQMDLPPRIPTYPSEWGLPFRLGCHVALDALNHALQGVLAVIASCPPYEKEAMYAYLSDICWRFRPTKELSCQIRN